MRFAGRDKGMVLNRTNATACAQMFGDDTMTWAGQQVELIAMPTHFQGKQVLGLVTLPIAPAPAAAPAPAQFDDQSQVRSPRPHDLRSGGDIIEPHAVQPQQVDNSSPQPVNDNLDDLPF